MKTKVNARYRDLRDRKCGFLVVGRGKVREAGMVRSPIEAGQPLAISHIGEREDQRAEGGLVLLENKIPGKGPVVNRPLSFDPDKSGLSRQGRWKGTEEEESASPWGFC